MPAEWEPHERTLMAWPTDLRSWGRHLDLARQTYAGLAAAILDFEPLTMMVKTRDKETARRILPGGVDLVEIPYDTAWVRDSGPFVVIDDAGGRAAIDFAFNSWGAGFGAEPRSGASAAAVLEYLGIERIESSMVLEGGAITVDGEGTLITTEQCLLNPNRNPSMSKADIERELGDRLGIQQVIWLPLGIVEDPVTDGHVDAVCTFVRPGVVVFQGADDPADPNHERMAANRAVLADAVDARGRSIEVIDLPPLPGTMFDGRDVGVAYANTVIVNGGVIVGTGDFPSDAEAIAVLADAFPDREIVGVPGTMFSYAGGGPHCTTQQIPTPQEAR
ncbi:agmatine deiminase family protein [bacterium]|nr:agmatine deiminase family protein [bacterium]